MKEMTLYLFQIVLVTGGVTLLLRAFPFLVFGSGKKPPEIIHYIGKVVSPAAIAMLVAYCYCAHFQVRPFSCAYGWNLPEITAGILVVALHLWKRNALLSIVSGVFFYMFLVQKIFP